MNLETKTKIQCSAYKDLLTYKRVILKWSTGTGKTLPAIYMLNNLFNSDKIPRVLIVVAVKAHKDNWKKEINLWWKNCPLNISFTTYISFPKYAGNWDFVIFDECHHLSERCRSYLDSFNTKYSILLSAIYFSISSCDHASTLPSISMPFSAM